MSTNRSMVSISPLPYLTAVPGGASRWLCAAGIRFTALSCMVATWAPVLTIALTLRCFRMAAQITPDNCSTSLISVDHIVADGHTVTFSATETIITDG